MSKLSIRLQIIADLVTKKRICDVGCDHGKLVNYLLSNNKVDYAICSDISEPSLNKAKDLLKNKLDNVEFICCNGLKAYGNKSIEQCIISGMGGDEIIDIISSSPIQIDSFILSPQHNILNVKKFMLEKGYNINYDLIISDKNKFYNIFRCEKSDSPKNLSNFQLIIGDTNFIDTNSAAEGFVEYEIRKINNILSTHKVDNNAMLEYLELLKEFYKRKEIYEKNVRVSKTRYGNK